MRLRFLALFATAFAIQISPSRAAEQPLPAYLVQFATGRIQNDGKLDEAPWSTAKWSREFVWIDAGDAVPVRSRFKATYDKDALHFAFEYESPNQTPIPLDPELPRACEIFLDPEGRGSRYLEFAVSPEGSQHCLVWSGKLSVKEWRSVGGPTARAGILKTAIDDKHQRTIFEISFPWKSLANKSLGSVTGNRAVPPARGDAWRANFSRVEQEGDFVWSACGFYYMHHPNTFGWLVFAGEQQPLTQVPDNLVPQPDDTALNHIAPEFKTVRSTYWVHAPVTTASNGDRYIVNKNCIERLGPDGTPRYSITRRNGLPQFVRSFVPQGDEVYLAGSGLKAGLYKLDASGTVTPVGSADGYQLSGVPSLIGLDKQSLLVVQGDRFQRVHSGVFSASERAGASISRAVQLAHGRLALGTSNGLELHDGKGGIVAKIDVAGGISQVIPFKAGVLAISAREGVFRMNLDGSGGYYLSPLRIKFTAIHDDGHGKVWVGFTGGLIAIEDGRLDYFHEPLGLSGVQILSAATNQFGETVFLATIPNTTWYRSNKYSAFLIVYDGRNWKEVTIERGLPGHVSAVTSIDGKIFVSSTMGVFEYVPEPRSK